MTEVSFHFNMPDKLAHACRVVRKALNTGARVTVTGDEEVLRQFDVRLWTFSDVDFIPHCYVPESTPQVVAASPVLLAPALDPLPHQQVLLNLGGTIPRGFERFEKLVELVSLEEDDRTRGRLRWKHYADRGYAIERHDLASKE